MGGLGLSGFLLTVGSAVGGGALAVAAAVTVVQVQDNANTEPISSSSGSEAGFGNYGSNG